MALGSQASTLCLLIAALAPAADLRLEVRHDHLWGHRTGILEVKDAGLAYREDGTDEHARDWSYGDIQQLVLSPRRIRILTYRDVWWKAGADREYEFDLLPGRQIRPVYDFLRAKLDQRFVAALADAGVQPLWEVRVKHLRPFGGTHGLLTVGADRIVFTADGKSSRTWRLSDIENISTSGPFQLTVVTYEKQFNFQLKEPLDEARYDDLWRRLFISGKEKNDEKSDRHSAHGFRPLPHRGGKEGDLHGSDH